MSTPARWKHGLLNGAERLYAEVTRIGRLSDVCVVIFDDNKWAVEINGQIHSLVPNGKTAIATLPLLEQMPEVFAAALEQGLALLGLASTLAEEFPIGVTLCTALRSKSPYWVELAIRWLEAKPSRSEEILAALAELARAGTQAHRHRAARLLRSV